MDVEVERSVRYLFGLQSHGIKPGLTPICEIISAA